jgi:hypothetical protein
MHRIPSHLCFSSLFFLYFTSLTFPVLTHTAPGPSVYHVPLTVFVHRLSAWIDKLPSTASTCVLAHSTSLDYNPSMYGLGLSTNTARLHGRLCIHN